MKKEKTPGMDASIKLLDEMIHNIISSEEKNVVLPEQLHSKTESDIRWDTIRHLRFIGNAQFDYLIRFNKSGLDRGFYSNDDTATLQGV